MKRFLILFSTILLINSNSIIHGEGVEFKEDNDIIATSDSFVSENSNLIPETSIEQTIETSLDEDITTKEDNKTKEVIEEEEEESPIATSSEISTDVDTLNEEEEIIIATPVEISVEEDTLKGDGFDPGEIVFGAPPAAAQVNKRVLEILVTKNPKKIIFQAQADWDIQSGTDISVEFTDETSKSYRTVTADRTSGPPGGGVNYSVGGEVDYTTRGVILNVKKDGETFYIGGFCEGVWKVTNWIGYSYDLTKNERDAKRQNAVNALDFNAGYSKRELNRITDSTDSAVFSAPCNHFNADLEEIDLSNGVLNISNGEELFKNCTKLKKISIGAENYKNITNFRSMFENCVNLTEVSFLDNATVQPRNMNRMFASCSELKKVDICKFDITNNPLMTETFMNCPKLETIVAGNGFNSYPSIGSFDTFLNCNSLMGSNGTKFNSSKTDSTYAIIDGSNGNPGYFSSHELKITYDPNGGTGGSVEDSVFLFDDYDITDYSYTKDGYTFGGYIDQDNVVHGINTTITEIRKNYTLKAKWDPIPPKKSGGRPSSGNSGGSVSYISPMDRMATTQNKSYLNSGTGGFLATSSIIIIQNQFKNSVDCFKVGNELYLLMTNKVAKKMIASPSEFSSFFILDPARPQFMQLRKVCVCIDGYIVYYDNNGKIYKGIADFNNIYKVNFDTNPIEITPSETGKFFFKEDTTLASGDVIYQGKQLKISPTGKIIE